MPSSDPFDLERFVQAQSPVFAEVCAELDRGSKTSHWMWFVFPQLRQLGRSAMARHYGLAGLNEARAYLAHPLLASRLRDCCERLLALPPGRTALEVFGATDEMKLRSSMTLFAAVRAGDSVFSAVLDRFFAGQRDPLTQAALGAEGAS